MALFGSSFVMGVAFQCMVRLTVYAMSYELYVVEWHDGDRCARTMLLIKCGFLEKGSVESTHPGTRRHDRRTATGEKRTRHRTDGRCFLAKWTVRLTALTLRTKSLHNNHFISPRDIYHPGKPCYSTP